MTEFYGAFPLTADERAALLRILETVLPVEEPSD